ncbi:MAG: site-specific integrase [Halobacteriales archaeon]|nr:site-specific integrase [Halobacteriales archaeon]
MSELDPIEPGNALKLYLADRGGNLSEATITSHRSRLSTFVEWLDEQGIDNLNDLTGRMVKEYQLQRREETGWATVTEKTQMDTVRVFVRWAEGIEAVENDLSERMKQIYDEFGFENSMGYMFKEYLEVDGDKLKLSQHHVDGPEFIRGMLELNRIHQMQDTEKPDSNDFADMEICAHALITDCDYRFIESKWINTSVIDNVVSKLDRDGPTLFDDYDAFLSELDSL